MTNKTPERSVEEIVEEFWEKESGTDIGYLHHKNDFIEAFTQTLQEERQKRDEVVREEREKIISRLRNGVMTAFSEYNEYSKGYTDCQERMNEIISRELTQPNNSK